MPSVHNFAETPSLKPSIVGLSLLIKGKPVPVLPALDLYDQAHGTNGTAYCCTLDKLCQVVCSSSSKAAEIHPCVDVAGVVAAA